MAEALACLDDPDRFVREAVLVRLVALACVEPLDPRSG
jgi:hypothetical protein